MVSSPCCHSAFIVIEKEDFTEDIISAILFLASKEAGWITGLIMPVDGGVSNLCQIFPGLCD